MTNDEMLTLRIEINVKEKYRAFYKRLDKFKPWYHRWNNGNNPVLWTIRTTLLKLEHMGLVRLRIGQLYKFKDLLP